MWRAISTRKPAPLLPNPLISHCDQLVFHLPLASEGKGQATITHSGCAKSHYIFQRSRAWLVVCLAVGLIQGCTRPEALRQTGSSADSAGSDQNLPFHADSNHSSANPASADPSRPAVPLDGNSQAGAPFRSVSRNRILPTGTLITVELQNSLSFSQIRPGDAVAAVMAGAILVDGDTLVENGALVGGRIEAIVQPPAGRGADMPDPGLVRLTLNTITLGGHSFPLQTASLFVKANTGKPSPGKGPLAKDAVTGGTLTSASASTTAGVNSKGGDARILKGRRLTFRLTAPLILGDASSVAAGRMPDSSKP